MKREKQNKGHILESFILNLESCKKVLDEFDERLWMVTVDKVTVIPDGKLVFSFKDGTEIEV